MRIYADEYSDGYIADVTIRYARHWKLCATRESALAWALAVIARYEV